MRSQVLVLMVYATIWASGCQAPQPTAHATSEETREEVEVSIPISLEITARPGEPTVIYGQRSRDCDSLEPPSFDSVVENDITNLPKHGRVSDGGIGRRYSQKCGKSVPVRAVSYTSRPGFGGKDIVVFGVKERVFISVEPE